MGFPVERTRYRLKFAEEHLAGLEVEIAAMSVREAFAYDDAIAEVKTTPEYVRLNIETIARQLVSWNLEKAPGEPWPMTLEGLQDLDGHLAGAIIKGWLQAMQPAQEAVDPTPPPALLESLPTQPLTPPDGTEPEPAG